MRCFVRTLLYNSRLPRRREMVKKCFLYFPCLQVNLTSNNVMLGSRKTSAPTSEPGSKRTKVAPPANAASLSETFSTASKTSNSSSAGSCISDSSYPVS